MIVRVCCVHKHDNVKNLPIFLSRASNRFTVLHTQALSFVRKASLISFIYYWFVNVEQFIALYCNSRHELAYIRYWAKVVTTRRWESCRLVNCIWRLPLNVLVWENSQLLKFISTNQELHINITLTKQDEKENSKHISWQNLNRWSICEKNRQHFNGAKC